MPSLWGKREETLIERLCRESGRWRLVGHDHDAYWVKAGDGSRQHPIAIRYRDTQQSIPFQSRFPVQFPLKEVPPGLFARLLMRNFDLVHASWTMGIQGSQEAIFRVVARVPAKSLDVSVFDFVCGEIRDEIERFHAELEDRYRGNFDRRAEPNDVGIQFLGPVTQALPGHARYRMLPNQ